MSVAVTPRPTWLTDAHEMFQDSVRKFFAAEVKPNLTRWAEQGSVDPQLWRRAGEIGLLGAGIPEEYGGSGGDYGFEAILALEQTRAGDNAWGWSIHSICTHYILKYATEEQKRRWLPGFVTGECIPALAMSEPGAGSDLQAIQTHAARVGNKWVLSGAKTFISNGQTANFLIVAAKTEKAARGKGISLFVVEPEGAEGFRRGRKLEKLGLPGQDTSELFFDQLLVPPENMLGAEARGFIQLMDQLPWERLLIALGAVGASDKMLNDTLDYVKTRRAFGKRIMDFQNTRFKLAECKTKLEVMRAFTDACVGRQIAGELDTPTASMAKWWAAQAQCEIADECLQLHGGYGYMLEYPISRAYADARIQQIYGGTREIMKELIARSLDDAP